MCRSIQTLHGAEPPASEAEVRAAALQYVRKLSGYRSPSRANADAFEEAVDAVAAATATLLGTLAPRATPVKEPATRRAVSARSA